MTETRQGTPAWFDARRGKLTASNFGAAVGVCPWTSRAKALRVAIGEEEWKGDLRACVWGTKNEKNAVKDYMMRTGNIVMHKGLYTHPDYPWLGGSPDGLVGTEGIIEVKCPFVHQRPHLKIPYHYYCQVNGLMEIMDKEWCDFVSWTVNGMKIYRVYRDKELFDFLIERYGRFYASMKRGVADLPNVTAAEKREVQDAIEESDAKTNYDFWTHLEPAHLDGKWGSPPHDPFASDDDEPISKRPREDDGTDEARSVQPADEGVRAQLPAQPVGA